MHRNVRPSRVLACIAALAFLTLPLVADGPAVTVGAFLGDVAERRGIPVDTDGSVLVALAEHGIRLPERLDLDAALTEGDVVGVLRSFGADVTSSRPGRVLDARTAGRVLAALDTLIVSTTPGRDGETSPTRRVPDFDPFSKGKGLGKGKGGVTPTGPE